MTNRPDGKRLMTVGRLVFITGVLAAVGNSVSDYALSSPVTELLSVVALLGTILGGMAWMVGYIVFAISFIESSDR